MASTTGTHISLAILGGGISGLALGAGLSKSHPNLDYHIYEAVSQYSDVGAGLAFHGNAIAAMSLINPQLRQAYSDRANSMGDEDKEMVTRVIMAEGKFRGELVAELGRAKGRKTIVRAELLRGFRGLVPDGRISFGKRAVRVGEREDGKVEVEFQDGSRVEADCVVGADGVHTVVRPYILGVDHPATAPKNYENWEAYGGIFESPYAIAAGVNPFWTENVPILLGPHGYVNAIPLDKSARISITLIVPNAATDSPPGSAHRLRSEPFTAYSEDAKGLIDLAIKEGTKLWTLADHDAAPTYAKGNVAMMGDAAHATYPFNGQGAAQALEDAAVLHHLFSHLTSAQQIPQLFAAYDAVRRSRSQKVVEISRKFGRMYAYMEDDLHEDLGKMRKAFGEGGRFTNEADLGKQNAEAERIFREMMTETEGR